MDVAKCLKMIQKIMDREIMSIQDICNEMDISYGTWVRINDKPLTCSFKTKRKLKKFLDARNENGSNPYYE